MDKTIFPRGLIKYSNSDGYGYWAACIKLQAGLKVNWINVSQSNI